MTVISRRKFLNTSTGNFLIGVVGAVGGVIARIAPSHGQSSAPERSLTRDEWMARWMRAPKKPEGTLHLSRFRDPMYFLTRPISWKPNPDQSGKIFHRRSTDRICDRFCQHSACFLVSIATGWRLHVSGDHSRLSVLDAARFERGCRRDPEAGHGGFRNRSRDHHDYLYSLRRFGHSAWNGNARAKAGGEKRILLQFPTDPRVRWKDWKEKGGVFGAA
jgi:hypothetical protein